VAGRRARTADPETVLVGSGATTLLTAGVVIAVVGWAAAGPAFTWPGVGIAVLGAAGIVRERREEGP